MSLVADHDRVMLDALLQDSLLQGQLVDRLGRNGGYLVSFLERSGVKAETINWAILGALEVLIERGAISISADQHIERRDMNGEWNEERHSWPARDAESVSVHYEESALVSYLKTSDEEEETMSVTLFDELWS